MDAIYTYGDYGKDSRPRLQFPKRTGRRTTYGQWLTYQYGQHHDGAVPALGADIPLAPVIVNHGRWLWQCPGCLTAVQVSEAAGGADVLFCPACFGQAFVQPVFPDARAEIEEELLRQPGYRWNAPFRNWEPGWSLAHLRERTEKAQAQLDAGVTFVRAASIGTPRTWSVGEVLTASNMNTFVREIQRDLIGINGPIELRNALVADSMTTAERNALTAQAGMLLYNSTLNRVEQYEDSAWHSTLRHHNLAADRGERHPDHRHPQPGRKTNHIPNDDREGKRYRTLRLQPGRQMRHPPGRKRKRPILGRLRRDRNPIQSHSDRHARLHAQPTLVCHRQIKRNLKIRRSRQRPRYHRFERRLGRTLRRYRLGRLEVTAPRQG